MRPIRSKIILFSIITLLLLLLSSLIYAWSRLSTISLGYEFSSEIEAYKKLTDINRTLKLEAAALRAPNRIELIARRDFKLAPPRQDQIIIIKNCE